MRKFKVNQTNAMNRVLPAFSIDMDYRQGVAIYSDIDLQTELVEYINQKHEQFVLDGQEGLYERLSVHDNIKFFKKWFGCDIALSELLMMFALHDCAATPLKKCRPSEIRRVYYAKYYMMNEDLMIFQEPIIGVDIKTINTFIQLLHRLQKEKRSTIVLVSSAEHALLLSNLTYHLREEGLQQLEVEQEEEEKDEKVDVDHNPVIEKLFKKSGRKSTYFCS